MHQIENPMGRAINGMGQAGQFYGAMTKDIEKPGHTAGGAISAGMGGAASGAMVGTMTGATVGTAATATAAGTAATTGALGLGLGAWTGIGAVLGIGAYLLS